MLSVQLYLDKLQCPPLTKYIAFWMTKWVGANNDQTAIVFRNLNQNIVETYITSFPYIIGANHYVINLTKSTKPVEYAFQIMPMQKMDESRYVIAEFSSDAYEDSEYVAWNPRCTYDEVYGRFDDFAYIDMDSGEWEFRSGMIAYLLDDDGNYRLEWINP